MLRRLRALASTAALEDRHLSWVATMSDDVQRELTGTGWGAASSVLRRLLHRAGAGDLVHDLMYADVKTWLADDVLVEDGPDEHGRLDRGAGAAPRSSAGGIRRRLARLGEGGDRGAKALLRRRSRDDLPAPTRRRRKRAFLVPLRHWLGGELRELVHDTLTSGAARQRGLFRGEVIARLLREQEGGRHDHSRALWTLLCLELWSRNVLDAAAAAHD